jgi:hypothetical protein
LLKAVSGLLAVMAVLAASLASDNAIAAALAGASP